MPKEKIKKTKREKRQVREGAREATECIPHGSYFKAVRNVSRDSFCKMHLPTNTGNPQHTCTHAHTQSLLLLLYPHLLFDI